MANALPQILNHPMIENVPCLACGCLCDDLKLQVDKKQGSHLVTVEPACKLAETFFNAPWSEEALQSQSLAESLYQVDGRDVSLTTACQRAAEILISARAPLIFGLEGTSCEAGRHAVAIADRCRAMLDPTNTQCQSAHHEAIQTVGMATATLGEVATRADLILFWCADPQTTHPRHWQRYVRPSRGSSQGRSRNQLWVVDTEPTASGPLADSYLQMPVGSGFEGLCVLRALVAGTPLDRSQCQQATGVVLEHWQTLADALLAARYGAIFYDPSRMMAQADSTATDAQKNSQPEVQALLELTGSLNRYTRCVVLDLGRAGNSVGIRQVITWQTGFPAAVDFSRGFPRYLPEDVRAKGVLARREVDAAMAIGCNPMESLEVQAREHLASIPVVAIDSRPTETTRQATVAIRVPQTGVQDGGTVYRSDGVPLPLRPPLTSRHPGTAEVLQKIEARMQTIRLAERGFSG